MGYRTDQDERPLAGSGASLLWGSLALVLSAGLLFHFHDRFWWPPDDGAYAYAAQRMLAGDVQNGNLQELHPGYIGFLHMAAFALFGPDMLSLRYPLMAVTALQSALAFLLLRGRSPAYAAAGAVTLAALSAIQFLNPSPNWYALFMAVAVVALLSRGRAGDPGREILLGALLVATVMMRQLSGVLLAMGALTWLLGEARPPALGPARLGRAILAVMALGLAGYLWRNDSPGAVLAFGLWPLGLIGVAALRCRIDDAACLRLLLRLAAGGALALLPLVAYHLYHGSFATLYEDTVLATLHLTELDYQHQRRYWIVAGLALRSLIVEHSVERVASGLFWLALLAAPTALGLRLLAAVARDRGTALWHPLPVVAVFYALVATPFEIPIYLTYGSGLTLLALLWLGGRRRNGRIVLGTAALALSAAGIWLQAGQPLSRGIPGIVEGRRVALDTRSTLPGVSLWIEGRDQDIYGRVLAAIDRAVPPGAPFLALPANPELYFMSRRPALYRFYISATGIRDQAALAAAIAAFDAAPPPLVVHDPADKFNNWASAGLMAHVKTRYALSETIGPFDIYLPR